MDKRLRPLVAITVLLFSIYTIKAQWVSIPDTSFGTWLNTNGYSVCLQGNNQVGWQMDTSCPAVVSQVLVRCNNYGISDLSGIEYFDNLGELHCESNQLSNLPLLPNSLIHLTCANNQLNSLPVLPDNLVELICYDNELSSLPSFPMGLRTLLCFSNQLPALPELPDSLTNCVIYNNPITCLPLLKRIVNFDFSNTLVTCLPNYGNITSSNPPLNTLPLCDEFNANGCSVFWNISGKVYLDNNLNCLQDNAENNVVNIPVKLWRNNLLEQQALTSGIGTYSFDTDSFDTYTVTIDSANIPFLVLCPVSSTDTAVITAIDSLLYNRDFAMECKPGFDLAVWSISAWRFRPAAITTTNIHLGNTSYFYGINCSAGISGNVTTSITGPASYVSPASGALSPDNINGNMINYNIADFGTVNFNRSFNIMVQTDTTAQIGDTICFTVTVSSPVTDAAPVNNIRTHCFPLRLSWDPNNKEVYPLSDVDVNGERWLTYTINFQNTGTDTAIHIYITDTLDADLDVSTFQLLAYSHQPLVQIKENAVRFNFPNIMLVDSPTNEPLSHGYVQYKVKVKSTAPVGTVINNTAYIYFDFNAPVVTNTTTNTLAVVTALPPDPLKGELLRIYPNPASNNVTLEMDKTFTGGIVTVCNITGRILTAVQLETSNLQLGTSAFAGGVYFVAVTGKDGRSATKKLVIQK